jgi:hypothetical protein
MYKAMLGFVIVSQLTNNSSEIACLVLMEKILNDKPDI